MAKTALTIAISGTYNGRALERAREDLEKMRIRAVSEMGGVGSAAVDFGSKLANVGGEIHNMGYKMEQVGSKATTGITLPIAAAAGAVGAAAIDMDTSLTNVKKTVDGTDQQYQRLKDSAIEFSKTNAVSASQIMDLQALGAQLGYNIEELDMFSRVVSGLDIATNMDAETAGTELAQFANITGMAHEYTENYASAIVGLGNNMATTESDISHMAMRLAAAGSQVGMSQADILGLAAALSAMGVEAEAGGSAVSTIMSGIDKDVAKATDGLSGWADRAGMTVEDFIGHVKAGDDWAKGFAESQGMTLQALSKETEGSLESLETWAGAAKMSADDFAKAWRDSPVDALSAVLSGLDGATEAGDNMSIMLEDLGINSIRQTDVMKRLAGNSELVTEAVSLSNDEWEKNTALTDEVSNRNSSMAARFDILKNKAVAVAEKVGTPLVNALLEVIDASEPLIEGIADAAQSFASMSKEGQQSRLKLIAMAAAFGPVTNAAGGLLSGFGNLVVGLGKGAQHFGLLRNELSLVASATSKTRAYSLTLGDAVSRLGSTHLPMITGALGAVKTALAGLGIGLAIAAVGGVVAAVADFMEHERKVTEATADLTSAISSAQSAYDAYSGGTENAVMSLDELKDKTDEVLTAQGNLARSMSDQWAEYGTNAAIVDSYAKRIKELTSKYGEQGERLRLTKDEQAELRAVVDGYNDATGASVQVLDAQHGILDQTTTSILANAEAFKERARAEAALEMYKDLYKQQLENEMALQEATKTLNELKEKEAEAYKNSYDGMKLYSPELDAAQKRYDELTAAVNSNKAAQEQLLDVMVEAGPKFDTLDDALKDAGVSMEDFGDLTGDQLAAIKGGFDGTLASVVQACAEKGIEIPPKLASAMNNGKDAVYEAGTGLGKSAADGIAKGVEINGVTVTGAVGEMAQKLIDKFGDKLQIHSPSKVMAEMGEDIDLGLKKGIEDGQDGPTGAMGTLGQTVRDAIGSLPDWMGDVGTDAGSRLAKGISSGRGATRDAGNDLLTAGRDATSPLIDAMGGIGSRSGGSLASALGSHAGAARSAGTSLRSSAEGGLASVTGSMRDTGSRAASGFADAIGRASARQQGQSLAHTARDGMGSVSAYDTGQNFARGFSNGLGGVDIWSAAWNVGRSALSAIKNALGIASPSKEAMRVGEWFGEGAVIGMRSTEADLAAESRRMSAAMGLTPAAGAGVASPYVSSYQERSSQARQTTFNVTINVTARDERQAAGIGRSVGEELYLEFARRERAYA